MYAGTKAYWHEVLQPTTNPSNVDDSLPLFLCAFSADKGTEKITDFTYDDFAAMYGSTADFSKHGQPLLQAHAILAAGGRVLGKRIVADDATLANIVIVAEISENNTGIATIKYSTITIEEATSFDAILTKVKQYADSAENTVYPLFVIADNGRGKSVKNVRIVPDYNASRAISAVLYKIADVEGTNVLETTRFAFAPDSVYSVNGVRKNIYLNLNSTAQFQTAIIDEYREAFIAQLASITGYTEDELYSMDPLFGREHNGTVSSVIEVDDTGTNLSENLGLPLLSGSDSLSGNSANFSADNGIWAQKAIEYFDGTFDTEIFDLDQHKIDFCVDANYPDEVKDAIIELAKFRQDFYFFRDLGLGIRNMEDVEAKVSTLTGWKVTPFAGDYMSTYDIIDPFSRKQIKVTMTHGMAPLLVQHYLTNVAAPMAGEFNRFVITEAIPNTISFIPRVIPGNDQKQTLDDLHVNYANYSSDDGLLTVQSTYTSQDHWGPLSYSSNVLLTQMCIKAIRRYCPKIRFMLNGVGATDFSEYAQLIENNVIDKYRQYFKEVSLVYTRDDEMIATKTFNASLYCFYQDFVQGEIFDVFAMEGSPDSNPISGVDVTAYPII